MRSELNDGVSKQVNARWCRSVNAEQQASQLGFTCAWYLSFECEFGLLDRNESSSSTEFVERPCGTTATLGVLLRVAFAARRPSLPRPRTNYSYTSSFAISAIVQFQVGPPRPPHISSSGFIPFLPFFFLSTGFGQYICRKIVQSSIRLNGTQLLGSNDETRPWQKRRDAK